jgi:glycine/D-amino acid oxidase-like deaminating enzyme
MQLSVDASRDEISQGLLSLWDSTTPQGTTFPSLAGDIEADVLVIGGGYTGLSTALHLAESGTDVVVLEGREPGWGASGRNGGQVIPGLKYDPPELISMFGPDLGGRMADFVGGAPKLVFDLVQRHAIDCAASQCGWIQPAHSAEMEPTLRKRAESWAQRGAEVEILDKNRLAELMGTSTYRSGWLDKRGGCLNPLAYARGLAKAASRHGARIYSSSLVTSLAKEAAGFLARCNGHVVKAKQVVIATNAYSGDLVPRLKQSIVPVHSFQVATDPLDPALRKTVLPYGHVSSDSRRVLLYFRFDQDGRFLMGGVGTTSEPQSQHPFRHLYQAVRHIYPQIRAPFKYHWYGKVAITPDFLPHLQEPTPGLHVGVGYNGRGVAMATAMGTLLARRVNGEPANTLPFPTSTIKTIPFHGLRNLYVAAARAWPDPIGWSGFNLSS